MLVDPYKVTHWMNVRKLTPDHVAERADIGNDLLRSLIEDGDAPLTDEIGARLSEVLGIDPSQIAPGSGRDVSVISMSSDEVHSTRRPIQRDGIHFYNYYSMAGAPGQVAPVILDILCPPDQLPQLNNGHLEPAITVNIGPGDINGRWGEQLSDATWQILRANRSSADSWIAGDSYVEPSYCPHSYSLASETPARIISYTAESNLTPLFSQMNDWTDPAFATMEQHLGDGGTASVLRSCLSRRGHDAESASAAAEVDREAIERFLDADADALTVADLRSLGDVLGIDYRILLPPLRRHDEVGKTCLSIEQSRRTVRRFKGYAVASMASSPQLPDLTGLFMRVQRPGAADALDLADSGETHYMVSGGEVTLGWRDNSGAIESVALTPDGTAWVAPFVEHGWWGDGSVIKLGSGRHVGYLDEFELTNTFDARATLNRGRHDALGWGYDQNGGD